MLENEIQFLDCKIFIENSKIKFRKTFKKGLDTVFTNYEHDLSPMKYKHNLFTQLHRTRNCCSDDEQFEKRLEDLRTIQRESFRFLRLFTQAGRQPKLPILCLRFWLSSRLGKKRRNRKDSRCIFVEYYLVPLLF